jgi:galactokinase/mevalonate kinase-like predicted kinase
VFARLGSRPGIVLRSIDLGAEEHVRSYADLDTYADPRNPFSLAKAALAVAGFLPRFHAGAGHSSLAAQLEALGGGVELSLLAAMPKGSGLGTSSILTATVLAALSELCGLRWDRTVLFSRTMAVEQLLTTGGGWQDQAGAIHRGVKLVETAPGLGQKPTIHWLPSHLFEPPYANESVLLYYTGITRMAKGILSDIVRGMFLNSPQRLAVLSEIAANARATSAAVQRCDYEGLCAGVFRSWELNQRLDSGTNPPAVQSILAQVRDYLGAAKLLGAGGGGYLLLLAKDADAGRRARQLLVQNPPNPRARFVDLALSTSGLQVTRS